MSYGRSLSVQFRQSDAKSMLCFSVGFLSYGIQILAKMSLWFVFVYAIEKLGPRTGCDLSKNDRGLIFQKKMTATGHDYLCNHDFVNPLKVSLCM